jgi:hypothetical protein
MDAYDAIVSTHGVLSERVALQVFDALPERGPVVAIMDRAGRCWSSNPQELANLNLPKTLLADLLTRVDDGVDPVFAHAGDTSVAMSQLATENAGCGYLLIAIPRCGSELTQTHIDLIETLMNQIALVASLVERNQVLNGMQARYSSVHGAGETIAN